MEYGAIPKRNDERKDTLIGLQATPQSIFIFAFVTGVTVFLVTQILFNSAFYTNPNVVFTTLFVLGLCCVSAVWRDQSLWGTQQSVWCRPIGCTCLAAAVVGSVFGIFCYDSYGYFSFIYRNSRTYTNTVPSEPAASVADAGRMIFASEAFVDQVSASGYAAPNSVTYCVAPVRDMVKTTHVEFWAVGYDCCGWSGSFKCDDSGEADARGGIVVFDNPGYFGKSNRDYYDFARKKAEAQYDLISADKPIYVRWVKKENLGMLQKFYEGRSAAFVMLTTLLFAAVSCPFVLMGSQSHFKTYFGIRDS
jgi:hypothetical protein